ncbi:MAG TPA: PEP/pyruvate-binding domain-containing protein [bacterium]|nr:PEP/pyruvate-binding domain-containing protein [bacterium]
MKQELPLKYRKYNALMPHRVRDVLLVSSLYDAFILQEDAHLSEQIFLEYKSLSLSSAPMFTHVTGGEAAIEAMKKRRFDLVLVMPRIADMKLLDLGRKIKQLRPGRPVVVLTFETNELQRLEPLVDSEYIDAVFMWNGNSKILLAIIKYIEDRENVDNDISEADVRVIIVVEDSIQYYSSFLSVLYPELMEQSQSLFSEGMNRLQKLMRMRTRPKVLHVSSYEKALELINKYRDNLLGVISDVGFYREGRHDMDAGLALARKIRSLSPDMPILMQSFNEEYAERAHELGVEFVNKKSPSLLHEIRRFLKDHLGFGDFIFRMPDGRAVARAKDIREFEKCIATVPDESLLFHSRLNHISNWLMARSEFEIAERLKPQRVTDFTDTRELREYLVDVIHHTRKDTGTGMIADFSSQTFDLESTFQRIGQGSLGGKARGLAFLNMLLTNNPYYGQIVGMPVQVPQTFAVATDFFDQFMELNGLYGFALRTEDDDEIARRFFTAQLPGQLKEHLRELVEQIQGPLAVRSSSMLEDDMFHPFAGIYRTIMIPNNQESAETRLQELANSIKLVYASTFFRNAKAYLENTNHRVEEEKMAVVIQRLIGQRFNGRFYPHFAGVAHSYNFYPLGPQKAEDGVVQLVLGLGRMVVDGGQGLRFCPKYPQVVPQFAKPVLVWKNTQRQFYALDSQCCAVSPETAVMGNLRRYEVVDAEADGSIQLIGSKYNTQDDIITESPDVVGPWVVTFNNILKHRSIPLDEVLVELLDLTSSAMGAAVELEIAVDMGDVGKRTARGHKRKEPTLYTLQVRPFATRNSIAEIDLEHIPADRVICRSLQALGNGQYGDLATVVYVKNDVFDPANTRRIAREVGQFNQRLADDGLDYVLIGPGRWGSSDYWLGIPVEWAQISNAKIIVEASPRGYNVDPSQGTHFFHNITSLHIGYFTIPPGAQTDELRQEAFVDWAWLNSRPALAETEFLRMVRLSRPLTGFIDGRIGQGVLVREPGA